MVNFNPASIKDAFPTCGYNQHLEIVPAYYYNDRTLTPADISDKVVIGILLSISFPDNKGNHFGATQLRARMPLVNNGRRPRVMTAHSYILTFIDLYAEPNCFSVMYYQKRDFLCFFGNNSAQAETVRIGDALAFLEPKPSGAILGENVLILDKPERTTCINPQPNWPVAPPSKNSIAGYQNAFYIHHKQVRFWSPLLTNRHIVCQNITCDGQSNNCKGCFGRRPFVGTRILKTHVSVFECPEYDPMERQANFLDYKSFRTSEIFFEDFGSICMISEALTEHINSNVIRPRIQAMVTYINNHGGWTIAGWHRRGVVENSDTGETYVSTTTQGHLTFLYPSNPNVLQNDGFTSNLIQTPSYALLHGVEDATGGAAEVGDAVIPPPPAAASVDEEENDDIEEEENDDEEDNTGASRPVRSTRRQV